MINIKTETNDKYHAVISTFETVDSFQPLKKKNINGVREWTSQEHAKMEHRKGRAGKRLSFNIISGM